MTILAGAYCIDPDLAISCVIKNAIRSNLRRVKDGKGVVNEFDKHQVFITKWDSGAFNEHAWNHAEDDSLNLLVGDPLLTKVGLRQVRSQQLSRLVNRDGNLNNKELMRTRGAFSVVSFDSKSNLLYLATDMIGLRSIYYTVQDGVFIFASALRILEAMNCVRKSLSLPGMIELSVFSFPLAERTPYNEISILRECELIAVNANGINLTSYYDWTNSIETPSDREESASSIFSIFQDAIRLRNGTDSNTYAFLSGGMDSRAIVASLLQNDVAVEALNFSPNASQDQVYAQLFVNAATDAGAKCSLHCLERNSDPNFSMLAYEAKQRLENTEILRVDRPSCIWSGDGGSVGLGHVYMDETMLNIAESGDLKSALQQFMTVNNLAFPVKVLSIKARKHVPIISTANALVEINRYQREDKGRQIYLFLLFNDQRRHLTKHFESIDKHGLEFLLPFYDTHFLKKIIDTPAGWGILHNLYSLWFDHFPAFVKSTPWQTYPGHVPCTIMGDKTLSYQWANRNTTYKLKFIDRVKRSKRILILALFSDLPPIFSKVNLLAASIFQLMSKRDLDYLLRVLEKFKMYNSYIKNQHL